MVFSRLIIVVLVLFFHSSGLHVLCIFFTQNLKVPDPLKCYCDIYFIDLIAITFIVCDILK